MFTLPAQHTETFHSSRRPKKHRWLPKFEKLEPRLLLAVTILEEQFKTLDFTTSGSFSGTVDVGPAYQDAFSGTTNDIGSIEYSSATTGTGSGSGTGSGTGTDSCSAYGFEFSGHADLTEDNGVLSRLRAQADSFRYTFIGQGCNSGGANLYDQIDMAGSFSTNDFSADLTWSFPVAGGSGTATGSWTGQVAFQGPTFDAFPSSATLSGDTVEFQFQVTGQPVQAATHTTPVSDVQLFWSSTPEQSGIIGDRLADPVPVYWNQASGKARVDDLPMRPTGAAFLLVVTDADDKVTESDETNNVLVVGADLAVTDVRWNTQRTALAPMRGIDVDYSISGGSLASSNQIAFYWATGMQWADRIGDAVSGVTTSTTAGNHSLNEPARWPAPPPAATHILVVADPDQLLDEPSEDNNLSALRLHTPAEILNNAIDINPLALAYDGTQAMVSLAFQPGNGLYTMSEAEVALGVDHFNWWQLITHVPDHWTLERTSASQSVEEWLPWLDPTDAADNQNQLSLFSELATRLVPLGDAAVDDQSYYWNEPTEVQQFTDSAGLMFTDAPRVPDDFLGAGQSWQYLLTLVGVAHDGTLRQLPTGVAHTNSVTWTSTSVFDAGQFPAEPAWLKAADDTGLPPTSAGGVSGVAVLDNVPPIGVADQAATWETPVTIDVLSNDYDLDGTINPASVQIVDGPAHGTAQIDAQTGQILYTPAADYLGRDTFRYTVADVAGNDSPPVSVLVQVYSQLGISNHQVALRVTSVDDPQQSLGGVPVGQVLEGTVRYDTSQPFGSTTRNQGELWLAAGAVTFPKAVELSISGDAASDSLKLSYTSDNASALAEFQWQGNLAADRLPECLDSFQGTFTLTGQESGKSPFSLTADVESAVCLNIPPWQNPHDRLDVNHDGRVEPIDVLFLINSINALGSRTLPALPLEPTYPPPFYDVDGDGGLRPIDPLIVINFLNARLSPEGMAVDELFSTQAPHPVAIWQTSLSEASRRALPPVQPVAEAILVDAALWELSAGVETDWPARFDSDGVLRQTADELEDLMEAVRGLGV